MSGHAPIPLAVEWLSNDPFILVVDERGVSSFVTPADLDKTPSRVFFYVRVSDLEVRMVEAVRRAYPSAEAAVDALPDHMAKRVRGRHSKQAKGNVELDQLAYADFEHLLVLVGKTPGLVRSFEVELEARGWEDTYAPLVELRRRAMHSVRPLVSRDFTVQQLAEALRLLARLQVSLDPAPGRRRHR